jgi:hypothetical protein
MMRPSNSAWMLVFACAVAGSAAAADRDHKTTDRYPAAEGKRLALDAGNLDVRVRAADVHEIEVTTDLRIGGVGAEKADNWITRHTPVVEDAEDRLSITVQPGKSGFLGFGHLTARARLGAVVPSFLIPDITTTGGSIRVRGDFPLARPLLLRSSTGDMELNGAAGAVDIRSASGDTRIDVIRPLDRIFARTSSGNINLSGGAREAEVDTASGSVWLENLSGSALVVTSTGRITLRWDRLDPEHTVKVRSSSARVQLFLPDTVSPRGALTTTGGNIRCDLPGSVNEAGDTVELSGDGPELLVETASGAIIVSHWLSSEP